MFPRGQANLGSVPLNNYYQSKISISNTCYWKVSGIDSAFISSSFCAEQTAAGLGGLPDNFQGIALSTNMIRWRWDDNATAETNYVVKDNSGTVISPLLGINATNWIQTNLSPNTLYTSYAYTFNESAGADTAPDSLWTLANPPVSISSFTSVSRVGLSWNGNNGTWFEVDRAPDINGNPGFLLIFLLV